MTGARLTPRSLPRLVALLGAATSAALCFVASVHAAQAPTPPATAAATVDGGGPRWNDLTAGQRKVLAPLATDWNSIDSRGKERWLGVAARFPKMPAEEQQRANQRMVEWSHMTPTQRTQARLNFQDTRDVSKEERDARWKAYQALPDEKKRELAAKRVAATVPASAASLAAANGKRHPPVEAVQPKHNVVDAVNAPRTPLEPGSTVLRTSPGATTTLLTKRATPPAHQQEGQPKIAVDAGHVDRTTLLPKKGPQATVSAATPAASPTERR
jgi:hypothetical protein